MSDTSLTKNRSALDRAAALERKAGKSKAQSKETAAALVAENSGEVAREESRQMPLFPEVNSAMPHHWTRCSLFSSVTGKRKVMVDQHLAGREDYLILFSGEQLDMADNDVFLHVLQLAQNQPAGAAIPFTRSRFLEEIGRSANGKNNYEWLKNSLKRLAFAQLTIEKGTQGGVLNLIKKLAWDTKTGEFWLQLDPEISRHFDRDQIGFIDFNARKKLSTPLAKWLQNYATGHKAGEIHSVSVEDLRTWWQGGEMRNFLSKDRGLPKALRELEEAGIIERPEIYNSKSPGSRNEKMVRWWRPNDFGVWLRNYVESQPYGWHQVGTEMLRPASSCRTEKSFLAHGKGLSAAMKTLERLGVFEKASITINRDHSGIAFYVAKWFRPEPKSYPQELV